jgi:hypothetical protein
MPRLFALLLLPLLANAARADDERINNLTPQEATDGWLLLFDGETPFGWKASAADKLSVNAKDAALHFDGPGKLQPTTAFQQFALEFEIRSTGSKMHKDVQVSFCGKTIDIGALKPHKKAGVWSYCKLHIAGTRYKFTLYDNQNDLRFAGESPEPGPTLLTFSAAEGVTIEVRNVTLVPLGQKPLFNGKNLDGWKEFPGKKSKFSVNDKLELNLKDGPGDLQTTGKYGDFLLTLQCFSRGTAEKALNSGIFFRCREGEYQNGYECQIHNGFGKVKDYVVEEYDPETHKLVSKKKMPSPATDYGTGAIYRRVPARKAVAKEGEWFTLTVVAHGNHMASWVNGIQVADFTDNRPASTNPREGSRVEPGHISIQGHDPTTDLSFRNLRIAEYGKGN